MQKSLTRWEARQEYLSVGSPLLLILAHVPDHLWCESIKHNDSRRTSLVRICRSDHKQKSARLSKTVLALRTGLCEGGQRGRAHAMRVHQFCAVR